MNVTDQRTTNSITKTSIYQYNYDGSVATIHNPSGSIITNSYNGAAQLTAVTDSVNGIGYESDGFYTPNGALTFRSNGAAFGYTILYNTREQPCWAWAGTGTTLPLTYACTATATTGTILDMKYNYNLGADNGNVVSVTNDRDTTRSQSYSYDQVNRVATGAASTYATSPANCWGEQFGYDTTGNWSNLLSISPISSAYNGCTEDSLSLTVSAYNRVSTLTYDTPGNVTTIPGTGGGSYTFNAENLITSTAGVSYTYDGDNERVEKSNGKIYWRGVDGTVLDETDLTGSVTNSNFNEYVYFNGERVARRDSSNDAFYYVNDQVGSARSIAEVPAGTRTATLCFDTDYTPFGNQRSPIVSSCTTNYKFTGQELDTESSLYNFNARFYASFQGRFMSPDPGNAGADPTNPQRWNMYSYVGNNPLAFADPTGLDQCDEDNGSGNPTCTQSQETNFGFPNYSQPDFDIEEPQQNGQDPPVTPAPNPPLPLGTSGFPAIEVVTNLHLGFCQTSDSICARLLKQLINYVDYAKRSPQSITIMGVIPVVRVAGVAVGITVAHIPSSHTWCAGPVGGVATIGKAVNGGPLILGNEANAKAVLSGFSWNASAQATPLEGVQGVWNKNGSFAGPTGGTQGASVTASYSWCR